MESLFSVPGLFGAYFKHGHVSALLYFAIILYYTLYNITALKQTDVTQL